MRKANAFTLVELLVVMGILALLVTMVAPGLTRARDEARRTVCATNMSNLGKLLQAYAAEYKSYPHAFPWRWVCNPTMMWDDGSSSHELDGWPKIYGLLEFGGFKGTRKNSWGNWYYGGPIDKIWHGALCPSMDVAGMLNNANHAGNYGFWGNPTYWVWYHKWAVGYQWNGMMRAKTTASPYRYKLRVHELNWQTEPDMWQWEQPWAFLPPPRDGTIWVSHAVSPAELESPVRTAEAWDTWDRDSTPAINWAADMTKAGLGHHFVPGWCLGVTHEGDTPLLNASRHHGSPNILYGDGSVRSDADRVLDLVKDVGLSPTQFAGAEAATWSYQHETFGGYYHLVPRCQFEGGE